MREDSCQIIPFPTSKRVGKIRRTAAVLAERHGKSADQYWRQVSSGMRSQMVAANIPTVSIDEELRAFFDAVQAEMIRLSYASHGHGGAA